MSITTDDIKSFGEKVNRLREQIGREIVGQKALVDYTLIAIIAGGNVLLEGVPGLGKTRLVRALGRVLDLPFSRIQFTPDMLPADVTGTAVVVRDAAGGTRFEFKQGPVFASLVLADEINRATPKTQSALLEAMQEHTVTADGVSHRLPEPFFVLATQNPLEQEGTYPLPEAQLDRFFFKLLVEFPQLQDLEKIIDMTVTQGDTDRADAVATGADILSMREAARGVPVAASVKQYLLKAVMYSQPTEASSPAEVKTYVRYGASPRAAQAMLMAAKVRALMEGRFNVSFDDVRAIACPALRHRLALNFEGIASGWTTEKIIEKIIALCDTEAK
jgi:MoxR-like ATPase